jgi:hypothetical protein
MGGGRKPVFPPLLPIRSALLLLLRCFDCSLDSRKYLRNLRISGDGGPTGRPIGTHHDWGRPPSIGGGGGGKDLAGGEEEEGGKADGRRRTLKFNAPLGCFCWADEEAAEEKPRAAGWLTGEAGPIPPQSSVNSLTHNQPVNPGPSLLLHSFPLLGPSGVGKWWWDGLTAE